MDALRGASGRREEDEDVGRSTWVLSKEGGRWRCRAFQQTYVKEDTPRVPRAT